MSINMAPCTPPLEYAGSFFKTVEHAYHWRRAEDADQHELAERIRNAPHAGVAKALSREINSDPEQWQKGKGVDIMRELLWIKFNTDRDAYNTLMATDGMRIAEATGHPFWACGLDYEKALITNPKYWRGENTLGLLMEDLRSVLQSRQKAADAEPEVPSDNGSEVFASAASDDVDSEVERKQPEKIKKKKKLTPKKKG